MPVPRVSKSKDAGTLSDEEFVGRCREIAGVFTTVERMLREDNLGTFGHMITNAHHLLQQNSELASRAGARFILVDEFQDVNFAQVKVLQKLARRSATSSRLEIRTRPSIASVGLQARLSSCFSATFPARKLIKLEKNRRSLSPILHSAFAHISKNPNVFDAGRGSTAYQRSVLISAREEDAARSGSELPRVPVEAVVLDSKDTESGERDCEAARIAPQVSVPRGATAPSCIAPT